MDTLEEPVFMNTKEVAEYLRASIPSISVYLRKGMPGYQIGGPRGKWIFRKSEIDKWISERNSK